MTMQFAAPVSSAHEVNRQGRWLWAAGLLPPLALMAIVALQPFVPVGDLLRDPLAVAEMKGTACCKVYDGAVSNLGIVLWMSCAAICLFAATVVHAASAKLSAHAMFFAAAGLFTGFLGFDDLFLVHENVLPAFGVPQPVTYGAYAVIAMLYLATSWRQILEHNFGILICAIALLGISVGIDWVIHSDMAWRIILEDGAKLTGITLWLVFHVSAAWRTVLRLP